MLGYKSFLTIMVGVASTTYVTVSVLAGGSFVYPAVKAVSMEPGVPVVRFGFSRLRESVQTKTPLMRRMRNKAKTVILRAREYRKHPCDPYQRLLAIASISNLSKETLRSPEVQMPVWGAAGTNALKSSVKALFDEGLLSMREFPAHAAIWLRKTVVGRGRLYQTATHTRCTA